MKTVRIDRRKESAITRVPMIIRYLYSCSIIDRLFFFFIFLLSFFLFNGNLSEILFTNKKITKSLTNVKRIKKYNKKGD